MRVTFYAVIIFMSTGCVHFDQTYHFKETELATGEAVNYFRVSIEGSAQLSKARYVSGVYDERAIDLFFNEVKSTAGQEDDFELIFRGDLVAPGTQTKITPLSANDGRQLMIFSTNAKAVADTIGQFSESQITADAITNLLNRDKLASARRVTHEVCLELFPRATAMSDELTGLMADLPTGPEPDPAVTAEQSLRILGRIARELGGEGRFEAFDEADAWFAAFAQGRSR